MTQALRETYLDEGENLQFGDQYLDETIHETKLSGSSTSKGTENINLGKITERFLLEKYSEKTSNVNHWISDFENECTRFEILKERKKIETLKYLLEKQCLDWYTSMIIKSERWMGNMEYQFL